MKIAFFEIQPQEREKLAEALAGEDLLFFERPLGKEDAEALSGYEVLSVFIDSEITREVMESLPSLRLIATRSTGYDHIDVAAAAEKGIFVCNVPSYGENTVAEHTFALMLSLSRNIHRSHVRRLQNDFSIHGLEGFDLKGKTMGVIGTGKIGRNVVRIARGFGMRVIAHDAFPNADFAKEAGCEYDSLDQLLRNSDIITLHTPYLPETHHLINEENIKNVKRGAVLINTARGELVDTDALIWALENGVLSGCGLDVIEGEYLIREEKEILYQKEMDVEKVRELVKDHILLRREEVVYTPHIAFYSREALGRIFDTTVENIRCYADGACQNKVVAS